MATVVSVSEFRRLFNALGWSDGNVIELFEKIDSTAGVEAEHVHAYLTALLAAGAGLNDQTIGGVPAAAANVLTSYFRGKNLIAD